MSWMMSKFIKKINRDDYFVKSAKIFTPAKMSHCSIITQQLQKKLTLKTKINDFCLL